MLDATRLRVLVAVARYGSVTAAAHALNYAQPSISHHIARLEAETGAKLMERAGRGIRLTPAGQLLADRAEEILGRLDAAEAELAAHVGLARDRVRLAAFGTAISTLVAAACAELHASKADAGISVTQADPAEALRMLRAGETDVALVYKYLRDGVDPDALASAANGSPGRGLEDAQFVLDEPIYLLRPAGWASTATDGGPAGDSEDSGDSGDSGARADDQAFTDRAARIAILAGSGRMRWVCGGERCDELLDDLCRDAGIMPEVAIRTADNVAAQALVAAGMGVAMLPALALRVVRQPGTEAVRLPGVCRQTIAITYPGTEASPAVARFVKVIRTTGAAASDALVQRADRSSPSFRLIADK